MPSFRTSRNVRHRAQDMFDLVADVERYPEFLPWCTGLRVLSRAKEGERDILIAEMLVGYRALRGPSLTARMSCLAGAVVTFLFIVTVARAHDPLGLFAGWR